MTKFRICWFGIYDKTYPRNDILLRGLRSLDVEVIELHAPSGQRGRYRSLLRSLRELEGKYDVLYAAHPATIPAILGAFLSKKPVVMDALYSMYDAVVNDREEVPWYHLRAIKLWVLDWLAALFSDSMIVDTKEHASYWARLPFVRRGKMHVIYTGVQDQIFYPRKSEPGEVFLASFHGFYIPLQGVEKIIEAARMLKDKKDIRFRLIGSGQLSKKIKTLIETYGLANIEQVGRKTPEEVAELSREADVILGIFGDTSKAKRVIPNKVYEGMGLAKPVITMDSPSVREIFNDADLLLIENTPEALAESILFLKNNKDKGSAYAEKSNKKVMELYSPKPLAENLLSILHKHIA